MRVRNYLVVVNWQDTSLSHWRDLDRELRDQQLTRDQAREIYRQYEERFTQADGYEVVMVGADSIATLRRTHGHLFGQIATEPFEELLGAE